MHLFYDHSGENFLTAKSLSATLASGNIFPVPGPDRPMTYAEKKRRREEIEALKKRGVDAMKREWFNSLVHSGGSRREEIRPTLWNMIYRWDAWQPLHLEPRLVLGLSVKEKLKQRPPQVPVLVLEGRAENNRVPGDPEILQLIPTATRVYIEDAGHICNMEQPETFTKAVLEFITSTYNETTGHRITFSCQYGNCLRPATGYVSAAKSSDLLHA